ncbi:MAG: ParB/RepB/Spo0J family partition protein [Candidatus Sedimenticola sp. (ex Thyasira tokunagai)]
MKKLNSLAALMDEAETVGEGAGLNEVAIETIRRDPNQPRRTFPEDTLKALAASINAQGVVQPIVIRPDPDNGGYLLVTGERRWRSAQKAELMTIPAVIRDIDDNTALAYQLVENMDREHVPILEEAEAVNRLVTVLGTGEKVVKALGKSAAWVSQRRKLYKSIKQLQPFVECGSSRDPEVLAMLADLYKIASEVYGRFLDNPQTVTRQEVREALDIAKGKKEAPVVTSEEKSENLASAANGKVTESRGESAAKEAGEGGDNVSHVKEFTPESDDLGGFSESDVTETLSKVTHLPPEETPEKLKQKMAKRVDPSILSLQDTLSNQIGAAVKIDYDVKKGGVIHITFHTLDELDSIVDNIQ